MSYTGVINVTEIIDRPRLTALQLRVALLCGAVALLDGIDSQSIGIAAPALVEALGVSRAALGPVFSAALFGAMVGAFVFGMLADRFGRKRLLIVSTVVFGTFTLLTASATTYEQLIIVRFLAGIGLGGAVPCFIAQASEYVPKSRRAMMASAMFAGFPLGGMVGGFLNSFVIAKYGWQAIFYIGGAAPLIVAGMLAFWMPESLRFLLASGRDIDRVRGIVKKLAPEVSLQGTSFVADEERLVGVPAKYLFTEGRAMSTIYLWAPFFMGFGALAISVLWTPALLRQNGIDAASTAFVVAFNGLGAFLGAGVAGRVIQRFGALALVPAFLFGGMATAGFGFGAHSVPLAATFVGLIGFFLGFGTGGSIALASVTYPTAMRSTGIGWAMGMGRLGQTVAPLLTAIFVGWNWPTDKIMLAMALLPLIATLFIVLLVRSARPVT